MNLAERRCRDLFAAARVARLATVDAAAAPPAPHLVPVTFAVLGEAVYIAVDAKPKRSTSLKRLSNIRRDPAVSLLVDGYDEDWRRLWWVRADGRAAVRELGGTGGAGDSGGADDLGAPALVALREKYDQYADVEITGPLIEVVVERWSGWAFTDPRPAPDPR